MTAAAGRYGRIADGIAVAATSDEVTMVYLVGVADLQAGGA